MAAPLQEYERQLRDYDYTVATDIVQAIERLHPEFLQAFFRDISDVQDAELQRNETREKMIVAFTLSVIASLGLGLLFLKTVENFPQIEMKCIVGLTTVLVPGFLFLLSTFLAKQQLTWNKRINKKKYSLDLRLISMITKLKLVETRQEAATLAGLLLEKLYILPDAYLDAVISKDEK